MTQPAYTSTTTQLGGFSTQGSISLTGVAAGSTIIAIIQTNSNDSAVFSDNVGGALSMLFTASSGSGKFWSCGLLTNAAAGAHTVTTNTFGASDAFNFMCFVYNGGTSTGTAGVSGTFTPGTSFTTGPSITPGVNSSTVINLMWSQDGVNAPIAESSPVVFTSRSVFGTTWMLQDYVQPTAGAITPSCTFGSAPTNNVVSVVLALQPFGSNNATVAWIT